MILRIFHRITGRPGGKTYLAIAIMTVLSLIVMLRYAGVTSLWFDDLATIRIVDNNLSLGKNLDFIRGDAISNPPLFYLFAAFWLRVAPYGTLFIKLPSILFSAAGMFFCGIAYRGRVYHPWRRSCAGIIGFGIPYTRGCRCA